MLASIYIKRRVGEGGGTRGSRWRSIFGEQKTGRHHHRRRHRVLTTFCYPADEAVGFSFRRTEIKHELETLTSTSASLRKGRPERIPVVSPRNRADALLGSHVGRVEDEDLHARSSSLLAACRGFSERFRRRREIVALFPAKAFSLHFAGPNLAGRERPRYSVAEPSAVT